MLPSQEALRNFKQKYPINARDEMEILTQVFDRFMNSGLSLAEPSVPVISLLIDGYALKASDLQELSNAFAQLTHELYECMTALNLTELMRNDHQSFNYCFHSLRDNCVVLKHLSVT